MLATRLARPNRTKQPQFSFSTPTLARNPPNFIPKWQSGSHSNLRSQRWSSTQSRQPTTNPITKPPLHRPASQPHEVSDNSNPSLPALNIFTLLRDQSPAVRRGVLGFLAVLATLETSFWIKVIHSKFFAEEDDGFWEKYLEFLKGVRGVWMGNYQSWWLGGMWGL